MPHQPPLRLAFGVVNAYLLPGDRGDVLVDTGLPGLATRLLWVLRQRGSAPDRLRLIILTHVHLDHVGNLQALRRLTRAPVLVHRLEAPLLESGRVTLPAGQTAIARALMGMGGLLAQSVRVAPTTPDVVVDDDVGLREFGVAGRILHTPGHTRGSISVLLDSGDAVVGDLCQNGWGFGMGLGRIHLPLADLPHLVGDSWDRLLASGVRRLYPGHGAPFDTETLRAARSRLTTRAGETPWPQASS
jgi:glyoxylase-like metal-dependent hydrolase (beta-lactamase superfamily II)